MVYFEKEHSKYDLPILEFIDRVDKSYEIFYQWVLRLGYFPGVGPSIEDCTKRGDLVVIINPQGDFTPEEVLAVQEYLAGGGKVLLMDDPANTNSSANSLLRAFDMEIKAEEKAGYKTVEDITGQNTWPVTGTSVRAIDGGNPALLTTEGGTPVFSIAKVGDGTLAVMTFSSTFVDSKMGIIERVVPDDRLKQIFALEFTILRGLINNSLEAMLSTPAPASAPTPAPAPAPAPTPAPAPAK
jgi:hypothetical protein